MSLSRLVTVPAWVLALRLMVIGGGAVTPYVVLSTQYAVAQTQTPNSPDAPRRLPPTAPPPALPSDSNSNLHSNAPPAVSPAAMPMLAFPPPLADDSTPPFYDLTQEPDDAGDPFSEPQYRLATDPLEFERPDEILPEEKPHLTAFKSGFFQKLSFLATPILKDGDDGLGIVETELAATFALPAPTKDHPLLLIPSFNVTFFDGPAALDLPPSVYAALFDFLWAPKLGERWRAVLSAEPGWYNAFDGDPQAGFRMTGKAFVRYDWVPDRVQVTLGALYINRVDLPVVPIAGVLWKPTDDWSLDLMFPKTKIARRLNCGEGYETWLYLGGGFGGNNWVVETAPGVTDKLILRDWRLTFGWERKLNGGAGLYFEAGYVFARDAEWESIGVEYLFEDTAMFRGGIAF